MGRIVMGRKKELECTIDRNGCFICTSHAVSPSGYPVMTRYGRAWNAHRLVYEQEIGPTEGADVHHTCEQKLCINPAHLELVEGRVHHSVHNIGHLHNIGEKNGQAKLNVAQVQEIRANIADSQKTLADRYGISKSQVGRICNNECWKFVV